MASAPIGAAAQSTAKDLKAFGSRIGDRENDANNTQVIRDRRVNARLDTRINSRLDARLDRFAPPEAERKWAYTPQTDDGTKARP